MLSATIMAEVDDAESIAVRICEHDEVRVLRIAVPVDPFGPKGHKTRHFGRLLSSIGHMQIQVQTRVVLWRRLAALKGDPCSGAVGRREHHRPSPESVLAHFVAERSGPKLRCSPHVSYAQRDHAYIQHELILANPAF